MGHTPHYSGDEIALGIALAVALHAIPVARSCSEARSPLADSADEQPLVAQPVDRGERCSSSGKPLDPKKLPDRLVPQQRTAPKKQIVASREDPPHKTRRTPGRRRRTRRTRTSRTLIAKSDPFAEDAGRQRPERRQRLTGVDGGHGDRSEQGPRRRHVRGEALASSSTIAGRSRPSSRTAKQRSSASSSRSTSRRAWSSGTSQATRCKQSGNDLFDDSARSMLQKLLDDRTALARASPGGRRALPGRTDRYRRCGDMHGDASRCR